MSFVTLAPGSAIFLDANIFVYSIMNDPSFGAACTDLLIRIDNGELAGHTSAAVLADVAHRLMTFDAMRKFGWPYQETTRRLRRQTDEIKKLSTFQTAIAQIAQSNIAIAPVTVENVVRATEISRQHGLLTNDALLIAAMESVGIVLLASNDADLDRVPGITRFAPH
jgi:predicted nucleic acid-binding protein